ncbi:HtaA domain-containing protein [Streptomyces bauhiniae]|uniref:HtaA domain-containing protein n=1 Tax=Streptomyces bauhiniae TaxID=2340725 RepID=UPI00331B9376
MTTLTKRSKTAAAVLGLLLGAASGLLVAGASPASAAPVSVSGASLAWGLSGEQGGGAFFGGCNFLSAGKAKDTGSSRLWTENDGFYSTSSGHVTVEKPDADEKYAPPTWATKCQDPNGKPVSPGSPTSLTRNRVVFSEGTGTADPETGTATVHWTGSVTSVFYGGLTYWSATDPVLEVAADGTGTLTATASGYGADMNDPGKWVPLPEKTVTLADLHGVKVSSTGFTVTPDYLGVSVRVPEGATGQPAKSAANEAYWGAFPQSFVDFQQLTGQSSYWFTSGGARDAAKPATPLAVSWSAPSASPTPTTTPTKSSPSPTASATPTRTVTPKPSNTPTQSGSCELADGIMGGSLTWGFKKSFRSYVGGSAANAITAGDGLKILAQDEAVAGKQSTGTYQWPFESSSAYTSPDDFTVQYGGRITYSYPAHYFKVVIADPRLTVHGKAGTLYADVSLTVSAPGTEAKTDARDDVALASLDLSGSAPKAGPAGISRTLKTAILDTKAFTFNGSSFYEKGQRLDDATVLLSGCSGNGPAPSASSGASGGVSNPQPTDGDSGLVPDLHYRPDSLASTGADAAGPVTAAVACVATGVALVLIVRRRKGRSAAHR